MSAVDNIIGMALIAGIVIAGWFMMQMSSFDQDTSFIQSNQFNFEQQKLSRDLGSILEITEPITKLPASKVIGDLIYSGRDYVEFQGAQVDMKNGFLKNVFDGVYGENNYYIQVSPPISKVRMFFIIDGSSTMSDDINKIDKIIPEFEKKVQDVFSDMTVDGKQISTEIKVYILHRGDGLDMNINCKSFSSTFAKFGAGSCINISQDNKMNTPAWDPSLWASCSQVNNTYQTDFLKRGIYYQFKDSIYSDTNEYFLGYDLTYRGNHCKTNSFKQHVLRGEFYEDWATGTAYVAKIEKKESYFDADTPVVTLFFPISDELSTGSEADSCYSLGKSSSVTDYFKMRQCKVCAKDENRFIRSDKSINHAINIFNTDLNISSLGYKVFPILTKANYFAMDEKVCNANGDVCDPTIMSPDDINRCRACCGLANCSACVIDYVNSDNNTGLHADNNIMKEIRDDMNRLALGTGGMMLDFSNGYDSNKLSEAIIGLAKASATFTLGNSDLLNQKIDRITISRIIPLGSSNLAEMKVTVASYRGDAPTLKADYTNLKPVAMIKIRGEDGILTSYGQLEVNDGTDNVKVTIDSVSFDPEGEKIDLNWYIDGVPLSDKKDVKSFDYNFYFDGNYKIKLEVFDPFGASGAQEKIFKVSTKPVPKITLYIVPLNWGGLTADSFRIMANKHADAFLGMVPCPEKFGVEIINPNDVSPLCKNLNVGINNSGSALSRVLGCVESAYGTGAVKETDRVMGLTGKLIGDFIPGPDISDGIMGYTNFFQKAVIANFLDSSVFPHEVGHTYNFCDEYSLNAWLKQDKLLKTSGFPVGCPNPYPINCNITVVSTPIDPFVCKKSDNACVPIENSLNCPFNIGAKGNCESASLLPSCGDLSPDVGETRVNCPSDFGMDESNPVDCFGTVLDADGKKIRGVMGPSYDTTQYPSTKDYTTEEKQYILDNICNAS